jgi:hypothetical protein
MIMPTTDQKKLANEIQAAIEGNELEIGGLHSLLHGVHCRINSLTACKAALQENPDDLKLARISSEVSKLRSVA